MREDIYAQLTTKDDDDGDVEDFPDNTAQEEEQGPWAPMRGRCTRGDDVLEGTGQL